MAMFLEEISKFARFLESKDHDLQRLLDFIVRVVLEPLEVSSIIIGNLNKEGDIEAFASSGISERDQLSLTELSGIGVLYPTTESFRHGKFFWINTLPEWGDDFPLLQTLPKEFIGKTLITFPIYSFETPVSTFSIISRKLITPTSDIQAFLVAVGGIFSLYYYESVAHVSNKVTLIEPLRLVKLGSEKHELTERQHVILRLISESRTNANISDLLGYSESTIRQEIMRIFSILGCSHRVDAAKIYKELSKN